METIDDVITKRFTKPLVHLMKIIDPERKFRIDETIGNAWDALSLTEQRRLYLYLLYKKWRGDTFYGTPLDIISNCHPYPTNWNGSSRLDELIRENRVCRARHNGAYGSYTWDEARLYEMTGIQKYE